MTNVLVPTLNDTDEKLDELKKLKKYLFVYKRDKVVKSMNNL